MSRHDDAQALPIRLRVNGASRQGRAEPRMNLADFLRGELGMTGTHVGCEHGVCGACTVLVDGCSARGCLMLAVQAEGRDVGTVEGLARPDGSLHPIQQAFHELHGLQCGFCTPGILMSVAELLAHEPDPDEAQIRDVLSGHLCRCTGYQNIVDAVRLAARLMRGERMSGVGPVGPVAATGMGAGTPRIEMRPCCGARRASWTTFRWRCHCTPVSCAAPCARPHRVDRPVRRAGHARRGGPRRRISMAS